MSQKVPSATDCLLAIALATGKNMQQAADEVGICRRTVQRRLANPKFRRKIANIRAQLVGEALGVLSEHMSKAAQSLAGLLDDEDRGLRFRASRALLHATMKIRDSVDLNERIRILEAELKRKKGECFEPGQSF